MSTATLHKGYAVHHDPQAAAAALAADEARHIEELKKERLWTERGFTAGRVVLGAVFVAAGFVKALGYGETVAALDAREMALPGLLVGLAVGIEVLGGALIALGAWTRKTSLALIAWLTTVTLFMHWNLADPINRSFALSNLAMAAALLLLATRGGGFHSVDAMLARNAARKEQES
jgi:putative oxidoreductase